MKKFFTISFLLLLLSVMVFAQPKIGLKAGGNIANFSGDDAGNPDTKFGFAFGGFFEYQFSPLFAVQPEIYYTMKGGTDKGTISGTTVDYTLSYDYVEVPVLVKVLVPLRGSNVSPEIYAGPFIGFNTTAKVKAEANGTSAEADIPNVTSTEFGLQFGGGIGFGVGHGEMGFDVRYILGLTSIDDSVNKYDVKNGVINFNIYYGFSLL